ncbi:alpha/beta fold hydrolase [Dyadobacter arcticus]|uniref:Pimeloyl-ACP methyl ester carboxylesterase n=1 Tax=Dyadobacter arcticus TaxID=1078754 RepID=A0ABX0UMX1_9BACT|nr:alpha/beta hydrolase [Dyadobacter arcticus]NIJ52995.1 pimeloyl-ACP methyl ester carboxylesterase [Dyadobacter arcticus]
MQTVISKDGTQIAYEKLGKGPAVVLIVGALASRSDHAKLVQLLSPDFTVYNYDRRGRGDSGDNRPYSVEREVEDIEALIDEAGGSANVYGISSGACLALEATAALGDKVKNLAVYEPPYDEAEGEAEKWKEYSLKLDQLLAADRRSDAVEFHMKFVGASGIAILAMKVLPGWQGMKALAPTIAYDVKVVGENRSVPVERVARIKANTLVMDGGASIESMPFMRATADKLAKTIPNAQRRTIEGEGHNVGEKVLAPVIREFFHEENQPASYTGSILPQ